MTEQLATQIANDFMTAMNPDRWNGRAEMPESVNTSAFKDENEISIKGEKYHLEITLGAPDDNSSAIPTLYVALVTSSGDILARYQTHTLASTHILQLMITSICKEAAKAA